MAGEDALGGSHEFAGSLGARVVNVFDLVAARTGLRGHEAEPAGFEPVTVTGRPDDREAYYPGARPIEMRLTGDRVGGRLLGLQLVGHPGSEVAKRINIRATAIFNGMTADEFSDLDLSYTPPLGSPLGAIQMGAQRLMREIGRQPAAAES